MPNPKNRKIVRNLILGGLFALVMLVGLTSAGAVFGYEAAREDCAAVAAGRPLAYTEEVVPPSDRYERDSGIARDYALLPVGRYVVRALVPNDNYGPTIVVERISDGVPFFVKSLPREFKWGELFTAGEGQESSESEDPPEEAVPPAEPAPLPPVIRTGSIA